MSYSDTIGDKDILRRKTPTNPKYSYVKPVVESGLTAELAQFIKQTTASTQRLPGEPFLRVRPKLLGDYINLLKELKEREQCDENGGFVHPMDEYRPPELKPSKEYLILDVRSEDEYKECHIEGALHYPKRRMVHATNPFIPEMLAFKNKENKLIVVYDLEEDLTVGQKVGTILFEKGIDNIAVLSGGLREFVQDYPTLIVGESPVPIVPRDKRLQKRADAISASRTETSRSYFTHKPKSLSNSLAKARQR
ncbi:testis specific, 14 [Trypanosoma theileri]|uniref:Testis specific, 14 n=1 Tax=Trypanosoma theileri TaxID=67003 RepID=A0A1X0PB71_9TRYP|nr:testis specific, 14 [Trypanosoma theileri]ORC93700.1 testis specific, 14 [Trypanosoma theileri]